MVADAVCQNAAQGELLRRQAVVFAKSADTSPKASAFVTDERDLQQRLLRQEVLDRETVVLRIARAVVVSGCRQPRPVVVQLRRIRIGQRALARVGLAQVDGRIVYETGWARACCYRHRAVESQGKSSISPVVPDRWRIRHRVTSTHSELVIDLVGQAQARSEFFPVSVVEAAATVSEDQRAKPAVCAGIGCVEVDLRHASSDFIKGRNDFPSQSGVYRQLGSQLPVVSGIEGVLRLAESLA